MEKEIVELNIQIANILLSRLDSTKNWKLETIDLSSGKKEIHLETSTGELIAVFPIKFKSEAELCVSLRNNFSSIIENYSKNEMRNSNLDNLWIAYNSIGQTCGWRTYRQVIPCYGKFWTRRDHDEADFYELHYSNGIQIGEFIENRINESLLIVHLKSMLDAIQ